MFKGIKSISKIYEESIEPYRPYGTLQIAQCKLFWTTKAFSRGNLGLTLTQALKHTDLQGEAKMWENAKLKLLIGSSLEGNNGGRLTHFTKLVKEVTQSEGLCRMRYRMRFSLLYITICSSVSIEVKFDDILSPLIFKPSVSFTWATLRWWNFVYIFSNIEKQLHNI